MERITPADLRVLVQQNEMSIIQETYSTIAFAMKADAMEGKTCTMWYEFLNAKVIDMFIEDGFKVEKTDDELTPFTISWD